MRSTLDAFGLNPIIMLFDHNIPVLNISEI